jgi:uncharacterized protein with NAD-binding domain and iron-sulfur cluster
MAKRKIAILGGGMAGLTAAYELSRTRQLRAEYEITLYQIGWRLGGKCASGRDNLGRIHEHGLHFWFGCYENAFRLLREVYGALEPSLGEPLRDISDALRPLSFTTIGTGFSGEPGYWPVTWPSPCGIPGEGGLLPNLMDMVSNAVRALKTLVEHAPEMRGLLIRGTYRIPARFSRAHQKAVSDGIARTNAIAGATPYALDFAGLSEVLSSWLRAFGGNPDRFPREHLAGIVWLIGQLWEIGKGSTSFAHPMGESLHVLISFLRGVIVDLVVHRKTPNDLSDLDFRDWLVVHGCDSAVARESDVLRAFYDMVMQYESGDANHPSMAAGAAIVVWLRMMCTTKGAMLWELQAGMGEAVVAPIYRMLVRNGVAFRFFRQVDRLELTNDKGRVGKIHLSRQVNLKRGEYQPMVSLAGLACWPAQPLWEQIVDGTRMALRGVNFESQSSGWPVAGREQLLLGRDFHEAILAIPMGVFKELNGEPGLTHELAEVNPAFRAMTTNIGLIPTQAMQLWCDADLAGLGWKSNKPASVGGPRPFSIWAEMGQLLRFEPWSHSTRKPRSLYYFCGVYPGAAIPGRHRDFGVPKAAARTVRQLGIKWLERNAASFLPNAVHRGQLDWDVLHATPGVAGSARFDAQYWRANVDPAECCPGSAAGATRYRLAADDSGFENLYLAGCWVNTGLNTACIESAVMAGMQAARAICGSPRDVWGEELTLKRN